MSGENSPDDTRDIGPVMKSPELQNLDTPAVSSDEEDSDDEGGVTMFPSNPRAPDSQDSVPQESPGISPGTTPADENKSLMLQENDSSQSVSPGTVTPVVENVSVSDEGKPAESASESSKEKS